MVNELPYLFWAWLMYSNSNSFRHVSFWKCMLVRKLIKEEVGFSKNPFNKLYLILYFITVNVIRLNGMIWTSTSMFAKPPNYTYYCKIEMWSMSPWYLCRCNDKNWVQLFVQKCAFVCKLWHMCVLLHLVTMWLLRNFTFVMNSIQVLTHVQWYLLSWWQHTW